MARLASGLTQIKRNGASYLITGEIQGFTVPCKLHSQCSYEMY